MIPAMPALPPPAMKPVVAPASAPQPSATTEAATKQIGPLDSALAGDWRSEANKARDVYRHPRETLTFFGVKPDQTVIEMWPGGGWYAEVLAPLLRDAGNYTGVIVDPAKQPDADGKSYAERTNSKLRALLEKRPDVFGKAKLLEAGSAAPVLGEANSADVVLTFRNAHNWVMDGNEKAMFKAMFDVLKPGGTLGVVDHRAKPDQPAEEMKKSGYLPEAYVISLAEAAGFKLEAKSEVNANSRDTKDYPDGVWTLPPRLAKGDVDRAKYLAIGESDRMTLRFTKPAKP
ncbi:MAG: methyltransferase [Gammaproteobacteria bacterium RIFCSPHIGHO2_12_FULL_63_22]|nr:MAG: methyltransferase [Gammaproteobacteria bacterium RIFCSPHIGHO2_12_FULL_63_22]